MVTVSKFYSRKIREGAAPSNPGNVDQPDAIPPVLNPPGSNPAIDSGIGIKLNSLVIGGVKRLIETNETLIIPIYWQYNIHGLTLDVDGIIQNNGEVNIG